MKVVPILATILVVAGAASATVARENPPAPPLSLLALAGQPGTRSVTWACVRSVATSRVLILKPGAPLDGFELVEASPKDVLVSSPEGRFRLPVSESMLDDAFFLLPQHVEQCEKVVGEFERWTLEKGRADADLDGGADPRGHNLFHTLDHQLSGFLSSGSPFAGPFLERLRTLDERYTLNKGHRPSLGCALLRSGLSGGTERISAALREEPGYGSRGVALLHLRHLQAPSVLPVLLEVLDAPYSRDREDAARVLGHQDYPEARHAIERLIGAAPFEIWAQAVRIAVSERSEPELLRRGLEQARPGEKMLDLPYLQFAACLTEPSPPVLELLMGYLPTLETIRDSSYRTNFFKALARAGAPDRARDGLRRVLEDSSVTSTTFMEAAFFLAKELKDESGLPGLRRMMAVPLPGKDEGEGQEHRDKFKAACRLYSLGDLEGTAFLLEEVRRGAAHEMSDTMEALRSRPDAAALPALREGAGVWQESVSQRLYFGTTYRHVKEALR